MDCNDRYAEIEGATEREFTPESNGRYAVRLSVGSCVELLECVEVNNVGVAEISSAEIKVYPNPVEGNVFRIEGGDPIALKDTHGKSVDCDFRSTSAAGRYTGIIGATVAPGFYILILHSDSGVYRHMITVR